MADGQREQGIVEYRRLEMEVYGFVAELDQIFTAGQRRTAQETMDNSIKPAFHILDSYMEHKITDQQFDRLEKMLAFSWKLCSRIAEKDWLEARSELGK